MKKTLVITFITAAPFIYYLLSPRHQNKSELLAARLQHEQTELHLAQCRLNDTALDLDDQRQNVNRISAEIAETNREMK